MGAHDPHLSGLWGPADLATRAAVLPGGGGGPVGVVQRVGWVGLELGGRHGMGPDRNASYKLSVRSDTLTVAL